MPSKSKVKGNTFERECVELLKDMGYDAVRAWGSDGRSMGESEKCDIKAGDLTIQCKRRKALPKWMSLEEVDLLLTRSDRGEIVVMMRLNQFIGAKKNGS
jgi:Holliday junction resolvase